MQTLGVLVDVDCSVWHSGGFILQLLPGADEAVIDQLEQSVAVVKSVTAMLDQGMTPEDMLDFMLAPLGYEITDRLPVQYHCNCSRERVEKALISIGKDEVQKSLNEDAQMNINCNFCNTDYPFDENALKAILKQM